MDALLAVLVTLAIALVVIFAMVLLSDAATTEFKEDCEKAGGSVVYLGGESICRFPAVK